jgi:phosphatidylinositol alpha-1,6-mannosyltransferase
MPVLLLSDVFPPKTGGSGRWFWEIYSRLPREHFIIAAGEHPRQQDFDTSHDLKVFRVPLTLPHWGITSWKGFRGYWNTIRRLQPIAHTNRINMIHCARVLPEGVMALGMKMRFGIPYLCYVHGEDITTARDSREYIFLIHRVIRGAERLIANSHNTKSILCEEWKVPSDRVNVLHPGVDTTRFLPAAYDPAARRDLRWDKRTVLLTVGRLQKRKGQDHMILAMRALTTEFPDLLYSILGDGEERTELERLTKEQNVTNHVQFLGEADDRRLIRCYQQCDLFILPNRQVGRDIEGFGMVLLEAQACCKPVIAGDSGGTRETMDVGRTGLIVDCQSPEEIARNVAQLLRNRESMRVMGTSARTWVETRFDWAPLASQAAELFNSHTRHRSELAVISC